MASVHPYFPPSAAIPGFIPNDRSVWELLPVFGAIVGVVMAFALWQTAQSRRTQRPVDYFAAAWFALCGFLHVFFEGYYLYHREMLPSLSTTFAQLWKEYALSDSRYLTDDVFTICVETITALVWGPLSWLVVAGIVKGWRSRHVVQIVVCVAHLYGVSLYYLTNWTEQQLHGVAYSRPEFLYFWVYYVGFNLPWAVVPIGLLWDSWAQISRAFKALDDVEGRKKAE